MSITRHLADQAALSYLLCSISHDSYSRQEQNPAESPLRRAVSSRSEAQHPLRRTVSLGIQLKDADKLIALRLT